LKQNIVRIILILAFIAFCVYLWRSEDTPTTRTIQVAPTATTAPAVTLNPPDPRKAALTAFFTARKCPSYNFNLISTYLSSADYDKLDYRLLPAISIIESNCGQHACPNNFWGWNSCKGYPFDDPAGGIIYISDQLANSHYYRGKTTYQKLRAYNPNPAYAVEVEQLMKEIDNE
jgi:hypothetical protein